MGYAVFGNELLQVIEAQKELIGQSVFA
jgi:hypothetical protein